MQDITISTSVCDFRYDSAHSHEYVLFAPHSFTPCSHNLYEGNLSTYISKYTSDKKDVVLTGGEVFRLKNVIAIMDTNTPNCFIAAHDGSSVYIEKCAQTRHIQRSIRKMNGLTCLFRPDCVTCHYYDFLLHIIPSMYRLGETYGLENITFLIPLTQRSSSYILRVPELLARFDGKLNIVYLDDYLIEPNKVGIHFEDVVIPNICSVVGRPKSLSGSREFYPEMRDILTKLFVTMDRPILKPCKKLYISRSDMLASRKSSARDVENASELVEVITRYGFQSVCLKGMSMSEQADMFANAEFVIGPHGAGFANVVYCAPGTKVMEFVSPGSSSVAFVNLCAVLDLRHFHLNGTPIDRADRQSNFVIDVDRVEAFMREHASQEHA